MAIDPVTPIPTQQQSPDSRQGRYSPEAIKMQREYAKMLMGQRQKPAFYTWANGLADASSQIMGGLADRQANEMEKSTADQADRARTATGYGNQAAGGAASNAPFSAANRAGGLRLSSLGQAQSPGQGSAPTTQDSTSSQESEEGGDVAKKAMTLSMMGETGKKSMAALFNISGDTDGSKSYGPFGLNSKTGSAAQYAKAYPEFGLTAKPGSPEFDAQWRRASASQGEGMRDAHTDWHGKNIMAGLSDSMTKAGVDPKIADDPRVQTYMADRKLQMGKAGLDTALQYAKGAGSPEEFIHTVSAVDKQRIGKNFPTYLKDHPDNVQGLHNRIDLRHNTSLAMANPEETSRFVDLYKGQNGQQPTRVASLDPGVPSGGQAMAADPGGAVQQRAPQVPPQAPPQAGQPPARMAQNAQQQYRNPPIASSRMEEESSRFISGLVHSGYTLPEAMEIAKKEEERRRGSMPEYGDPNELGQGLVRAPGVAPKPYYAPGMPGKLGQTKSGLPTIQRINPQTGEVETIVQFPKFQGAGKPQGAATPPPTPAPAPRPAPTAAPSPLPPSPAPAVAAAPDRAAPTGIAGPLGTPPPSAQPGLPPGGVQVASAEGGAAPFLTAFDAITKKTTPNNQQVAQAEAASGASKPENWMPYVEEANRMPEIGSSYTPPDLQKLFTAAEAGDERARNILMDLDSAKAANLKKAEKTDEESSKRIAGVDKAISDAGMQSVQLSNSIKFANRIINTEGFESGRLAGAITAGRNVMGELKRINEHFKNEDGSLQFPGVDKLIDSIGAGKASPNEAFVKIISGSVLQSLRQMLGPNSGQFRVQELKLLEAAFGNPNISLEGNKIVMDMIDKLNDRHIIYNKMATAYRKTHGNSIDPNFEEVMDKYAEDHPSFNPKDYDELLGVMQADGTGTKAAPAAKPGAAPSSPGGPLTAPPPGPLQDPLGIRRK